MLPTHGLFRVLLAIALTIPTFLPSTPVAAQPRTAAPDYQRYVTFHNDFEFPIYPVIQVPADLCDGKENTSVRRILVNGTGHTGMEPQETVTVLIPNESRDVTVDGVAEVRRCWYQSGRIYIFSVDIAQFEANMVDLDSNNAAQTTQYDKPEHPRADVPCFQGKYDARGAAGNCFTGMPRTRSRRMCQLNWQSSHL